MLKTDSSSNVYLWLPTAATDKETISGSTTLTCPNTGTVDVAQSITLSDSTGTVTGLVNFYNNSTYIGTGAMLSGSASINWTPKTAETAMITASYGAVTTSTINSVISKGTPVTPTLTKSTVTYDPTKTLANFSLPTGWSWDSNTKTPTVPFTTYNASFIGDANYNAVTSVPISLTVNKATPATPTFTPVTYDITKTLADFSLTTDWSWDSLTTVPTVDVKTYPASFKGDANYNAVTSVPISLTVNKGTPATPTFTAVTYDPTKTLKNFKLTSGWNWDSNTTVPTVDVKTYLASFTGDTNYNAVTSVPISLTVNKATPVTPTLTNPTVVYDPKAKLSDISLTGGWNWDKPTTVPTVPVTTYKASYTSYDINYNGVSSADVSLTVTKATSTITFPTAKGIVYGDGLSTSTLSGGLSNCGGTFAWSTGDDAYPVCNITSEDVTFTQADKKNYTLINPANAKVNIAVSKADPTITLSESGTVALNQSTLTATMGAVTNGIMPTGNVEFYDGTTDLGGGTINSSGIATYIWSNVQAGNHDVKAVYGGDTNYNTVTDEDANYNINKANQVPLTIFDTQTTKTPTSYTYGDTGKILSFSGGNGGGAVTWSTTGAALSIDTNSGALVIKNTGTQVVQVSKDADANYNEASTQVSIDVNAKSITITPAVIADKTYDGTDTATVSTPAQMVGVLAGDTPNVTLVSPTFTFADVVVGSQPINLSSSYSLSGSAISNYVLLNQDVASTNAMINQALANVVFPNAADLTYGQLLSDSF